MSAGKEGPRDWDKELQEVDKLIAGLQGEPPKAAPVRQGPGAKDVLEAGRAFTARQNLAKTWVLFSLATVLGSALTFFWPYGRECGKELYGYLGATGVFVLSSAWSTWQSWRTRSTVLHFLSIGLLGWSAFLVTREVLPRVGYAKQTLAISCTAASPAGVNTPR